MEEEYIELRNGWLDGDRNRESALRLLFLAWMHWADPTWVTGMSEDPRALPLWKEIYWHFGAEESDDAEFLYVGGIMAKIFPYKLGEEAKWEATANRMKARTLELKPDGFSPEFFESRGEYGKYFAHQARAQSR